MKKKLCMVVALMLAVSLLSGLAACGNDTPAPAPAVTETPAEATTETTTTTETAEETTSEEPREVVQLIYPTYQAGEQPEAAFWARIVAEFNRQNAGSIEMIIEEHPPDIPMFLERMNMLFAANDLPVIVHPLMQDRIFTERVFDAGLALDLAPYINADDTWRNNLIPSSLEQQTREDGTILSQPLSYYSPILIFYNTELFEQAGVDKFPETMDEWWEALEKFKNAGIPAFLLPTVAPAFPTSVFLCSLIGREQEGRELMSVRTPTNFNIPAVVNAFTDITRMFNYAAPESVGSPGPDSLNAFRSAERTAMYMMGPWVIGGFAPPNVEEDFPEKIRFAPFPGGIALDHDSRGYSRAIINTHPQEQIDAAIEFFRFMASDWFIREIMIEQGAVPATYRPTEADYALMSPIAANYIRVATSDAIKYIFPHHQFGWDPYTASETTPLIYPMLVNREITPEEAAQMMTDSVQYYLEHIRDN